MRDPLPILFVVAVITAIVLLLPDPEGRAACEALHSAATCVHILRG
jgi:hypothetical protein